MGICDTDPLEMATELVHVARIAELL